MAPGALQVQLFTSTEQVGDGTVLQALPEIVGESHPADAVFGQGSVFV